MAPHHRRLSRLGRGIYGRVLAEHVAVTDAGEGYRTSQKFLVFRLCPQTRERVNFIAIPNGCVTTDDDIGTKHVSDTEDYIRADVTIGANPATFSNFSAWFDNRRGMDAAGHRRHFAGLRLTPVVSDQALRWRRQTPVIIIFCGGLTPQFTPTVMRSGSGYRLTGARRIEQVGSSHGIGRGPEKIRQVPRIPVRPGVGKYRVVVTPRGMPGKTVKHRVPQMLGPWSSARVTLEKGDERSHRYVVDVIRGRDMGAMGRGKQTVKSSIFDERKERPCLVDRVGIRQHDASLP